MEARLISRLTTPQIYVVTEFFPNTNEIPITHLFENENAAKQYIEYLKETGHSLVCSLVECPVFHEVIIGE